MSDSVRVVRAPGPDSVRVIRLVDAEIARVVRAAEAPAVVIVRSGPRGLPGPTGPGGGSFFYEVEGQGTLTGVDDSDLVQAAIDASTAGAALFGPAPVRLRPGVEYRYQLIDPTGARIVAYGASSKLPDGGTAHNMFTPTGAWHLEGGDFDGNKGSTAAPSDNTDGNAVYQPCTSAGWAGAVELIDCTFHDFHWGSHHFVNTDATLHDPENAPAAAVYMDRVETYNCAKITVRFTGIANITLVRPNVHGSGSHGIRAFLCKNVVIEDGSSCDNPSGHGFTSLYCKYTTVRGGHYDRNGTTSGTHNGVTFGGDSTSNVNMPGQFIKLVGVTAVGNGNHDIIFDATLAGANALIGLGTADPIPVYAQVTDCTANDAGDQGIQVNASRFVVIHNPITDGNAGHGIELATRNATITGVHHAHGNTQKPLALEGATNWGDHDIVCAEDYLGNTAGDSLTIAGTQAPSRFSQRHYPRRAVTTTDTAKLGETLALDTTGGTFVETLPEIAFFAPNRITVMWAAGTVAPTLALTGSDKLNTTSGVSLPVFTTLGQSFTFESDPVSSIWTLVSGIASTKAPAIRLIGSYTVPGGNAWPNSGGSYSGGVPAQGEAWFIAANGTLGIVDLPATTMPVKAGDLIYARKDDPNTGSPIGWTVVESKTNKDTDVFMVSNSDVFYPSQKAVKTYVDTGLALKAPLASPALTGTPTAPTASLGTNTTQVSTTAFVAAAIAALVNSAPGILDTLGEIATALQADESTAAALATTVAGKQALDATLTALAGLATGADKLPYSTGTDTFSQTTLTAFIRTLLDDPDAATALATLGAQPADAELSALAGLTSAADQLPYFTGSGTAALTTLSSFIRTLLDDANAAAALATLGAAPLASPALTGNPTVPTQSAGDNSTKAASTAYVDGAVATATAPAVTGNNQTGTTYTFVLGDAGKVVEGNNASAITFTVPPNSSVAYPVGTVIEVFQQGAGQISVAAGAGVTIRSPGARLKLTGQYSSATLRQRAADEWCLEGDITT